MPETLTIRKQTTFVRAKNSVGSVMLDVIVAMVPLMIFAFLAHGTTALLCMFTAIVAALVTEFVASSIYLGKKQSILDGSAIITAVLFVFTLSPFTPWYIVAFGAAAGIFFGKTLWGGVGKNRFNPALVGREFSMAFFPAVMASGSLWSQRGEAVVENMEPFSIFGSGNTIDYLNNLFYKTSGAMGEYSILFLVLGGLYLVIRRRISWEIPLALVGVFMILDWMFAERDLSFSLASLLLGAIYLATDMPSSPNTTSGRFYYGMMIGIVAILCLLDNVRHEYMSYAILILNGFSGAVSQAFKPRVWGHATNWPERIESVFKLTLSILAVTLAVLALHYYEMTQYLVFIYPVYMIFKFNFFYSKKLNNPI